MNAQAGSKKSITRKMIAAYDLFVASGGGYMCDSDKWLLLDFFDRLEAAIEQGIPTVLVGQGMGPMGDPELLARARAILPNVDLIFYRNQRLGQPLLNSLGVDPERTMMTGDDAIELTYNARQHTLGSGIGVSLRVSAYTRVQQNQLEILRSVLQKAGKKHQAELIAVPISSAPHESDITYIRQVLDGYKPSSFSRKKLDSHYESIRRAGRCRVMVAGTYHGAIFALAQGIPVIGVAKSEEYFNKLAELSDNFGSGCQVLSLEDEQFDSKMVTAIDNAWTLAKVLKPQLLDSTERQIDLQRVAYQRVFELEGFRKTPRPIFSTVKS